MICYASSRWSARTCTTTHSTRSGCSTTTPKPLVTPSSRSGSQMRRAHVSDALVVAALVAVVCVPVWPGVFNSDSQFMLLAARNNTVSNYYAPLHGWVWGILDRAGLPAGIVFLLSILAFVIALLVLVRQFLPAALARLATALVVLFPPVYGLLGL